MPPQEPSRLGEYELLEKLGQGGMAQVYRGERTGQAGFKKKVALKRMLPQYRRNSSLLERFAAEARTNARLDHPNLVAVVDFGIEPEPYLVMEFVDGVTLASLMQRLVGNGHSLEIAAALFIGAEAAQGLDHAHRKRDEQGNPLGIVHRDVSPQNILLSNEGAVKVSDFGLVKAADNVVQTGSGVPIGKISYMAPEQANHEEVDARADVFSLGIVVWEMLTMRTLLPPNDPIKASQTLMNGTFPPPSKYNPKLPDSLDEIVMSCLVRSPADRTPSAQALGMKLRELLHEIAPGYGRDQLARLLGWTFPERGWAIDEPHEPAAQPSVAERASMPHMAAAPEMQRASAPPPEPEESRLKTVANVAPAESFHVPHMSQTAAPVAKPQSSILLWVGLVLGGGIVGLILLAVVLFALLSRDNGEGDVAPPPPPPATAPLGQPGQSPMMPAAAIFITDVPGTRFFMGPVSLGTAPVTIPTGELGRQPVVAVARGYQPSIVSIERQRELLSSGRSQERVEMRPHPHPHRAVHVSNPVPATVRVAGTTTILGTAPGLVLVPPTPIGGYPNIELTTMSGRSDRLRLRGCGGDAVCSLEGHVR